MHDRDYIVENVSLYRFFAALKHKSGDLIIILSYSAKKTYDIIKEAANFINNYYRKKNN